MHLLWLSMLGLMGLLGLAVLLVPAARRLTIPYTVLLAAVGCLLGYAENFLENILLFLPIGDFLSALKGFKITSEAVFFIFLPALVFEAALIINVRRLFDDLAPILFLAVIGVIISTVVIAYPLAAVSGMSLIVCLLLGVIVSATDPVAVVAIFKEVGAPKRLSILVEGESLFNDASAIVGFTILVAMLGGTADTDMLHGLTAFMRIFFGGIVLGFISARVVCRIISWLNELPLVAITLTISMAYLTFIGAEHYFHVSGVMAVMTAALIMGSRGRTVLSPICWESLQETWKQIGFWANSIIFILVGMIVPSIMSGFSADEGLLLVIILLAAFLARALSIFILLPALSRFGVAQHVSVAYKAVMFWGGLRGAVSLALALAIIENSLFEQEVREFIGILVTGFVLFTLFVNATTVRLVINLFGLGKLSTTDIAIRERATAISLSKVEANLNQFVEDLGCDKQANEAISQRYHQRSTAALRKMQELTGITEEQWTIIGQTTLIAQERKAYTSLYGEGLLSSLIYRLLLTHMDDLADGLKHNGLMGYREATQQVLHFDWRFHLATGLHRSLSVNFPLSQRFAERFEVLLGARIALGRVLKNGLPKVMSMLDRQAGQAVQQIFLLRNGEINTALAALKMQYPSYAKALEQRFLQHSALRLEQSGFHTLHVNALISDDVYVDLQQEIKHRFRDVQKMPKLDLGLDAYKLLQKVPLFENLPQSALRQLTGLLRPEIALPGKTIIKRGSQGDTMYFISCGVVDVKLLEKNFLLGSGDFVGELALLTERPRNADVIAKGFCELLTLRRKDYRKFLNAHPALSSIIEAVARDRLKADQQYSLVQEEINPQSPGG